MRELYQLLLEAEIPVGHYETDLEEYPYIIYQEVSTSYLWRSGIPTREDTKVEVIHFAKAEFDPSLERLKSVLLKNKIGLTVATAFYPENKTIVNMLDVTISREMEIEP